MHRLLTLVAGLGLAATLYADPVPTVADLVAQLGDARYAKREAAHAELLKRGEKVVPELDRLANGLDPEVAERLRRIRFDLVGFMERLKELLPFYDERDYSISRTIPAEIGDLITGHQPRAGEFLLEHIAKRGGRLHNSARRAFIVTAKTATVEQIDRFIQLQVSLGSLHRDKFPAKVGAMISMEAHVQGDWTGWFPQDGSLPFTTRSTRFLDGKPYEKPFDYPYPMASVGWYRVGEMAEGKHAIHAVLEYEFTQRGEKRRGEIRSKTTQFEVIRDLPDDLLAPKSPERFKQVKAALELVRAGSPYEQDIGFRVPGSSVPVADRVHVSWEVKPGKRMGLHCPEWHTTTDFDVDLCFDVEIQDVKTGKTYAADSIVVRKGYQGNGYIVPLDPRAFAGDREGTIPIKVIRKPSRAIALTDPKITKYFSEEITTENLEIKILKDVPVQVWTK